MAKKALLQPVTPVHTFRHRYNAVPAPGERLGGTSKTEPDKGISIKDLMDKYQRPPVEPIYDERYTIPVFPRKMDFAQVQAHAEALEAQRKNIDEQYIELAKSQAKEQAAKVRANAEAAKKAAEGQKQTDLNA